MYMKMNKNVFYKESLVLKVINFITIAATISYRMTILPDLLFRSVMLSRFNICCFIVIVLFTLFINYQNGLKIRWNVVKYPPLRYILVLSCLQVFIAMAYQQIESMGAAIFTGLNDFLLAVLVYSLLYARKTIIPREYIIFAFFNVGITIIALLLTITGIVSPYTNEVNELSVLFKGNVESGQTYFMPRFIAIQSSNIRVALSSVSYMGWSFEPHVFCLFVIPSFFYAMAVNKVKGKLILLIVLGLFIELEAFSVTSFLAIIGCLLAYFFANYHKGNRLLLGLLVGISGALLFVWMNNNSSELAFVDYTRVKLVDETGSALYSSNNLKRLFFPDSFFGDGIFGWNVRHTNDPNIGLLSWPFVIAYFATLIYHVLKTIKSTNRIVSMVGLGVLYSILHMLKLSQAAFCMPFLFLMLVILCRAEENCKKANL